MFFLPFNLIQIKGYSPTQAGSALVPFVVTMFLLGRWAGGLVDRFGSKLPLVIGPFIAGIGFALFAVPGADDNSYWVGVFPAVMVMSIGMSTAVAPLTTTVMTAVEERHAGVASGINKAVSRTAGLIAVAAFGAVMILAFTNRLETRLTDRGLPPEIRKQLVAQSSNLAEIKIPEYLDETRRSHVKSSIDESFAFGFRSVAICAAVLAFLSSIAAWLIIPGRPVKR
jgi:MFS family permease